MVYGFSSNLVIGVYIGFDNPRSLGKFETGSKAALPVFKHFVENALFKEDFVDFKVPKNIYLTQINYDTGLKTSSNDKNIIIEAVKIKDINNINNNNLISISGRDNLIKFRQFLLMQNFEQKLDNLNRTLKILGGIFEKNKVESELKKIEKLIQNENFWKDNILAKKTIKKKRVTKTFSLHIKIL